MRFFKKKNGILKPRKLLQFLDRLLQRLIEMTLNGLILQLLLFAVLTLVYHLTSVFKRFESRLSQIK